MFRLIVFLSVCATMIWACQSASPDDIASLEKAVASNPTEENVTKLLGLYQDSLAKVQPGAPTWLAMQQQVLTVASEHKHYEEALGAAKALVVSGSGTPSQEQIGQLRDILDNLGKDTYIKPLGEQVFNDSLGAIDEAAAARYIDACEAYALVYKGSEPAADYLYKASETARAMRLPGKCLEIYEWLIRDYPENKRGVQALFLKGFTYDNDLHQIEKAKVVYEEFLQKYPEDEFAESAKFLLENLGKSDDELLEALQSKSKEKK